MKAILTAILLLALAAPAGAAIVTKTVEYKDADGTVMEGYLAYDDAISGKRPGVLIMHQWLGLTEYEQMRARMLAELGYVAFAADIYGKGVRPKDIVEAGAQSGKYLSDRPLLRSRGNAALQVLRNMDNVDPARMAVIGYCFGGGAALELARSGADVKGTVTFHGVLSTPTPEDARNIKGKVLVCHGAADEYVTPDKVADFQKEMSDAGVDWYMEIYGYAKHSFTEKGPKYNEHADVRSWRAMKDFLKEIFGM